MPPQREKDPLLTRYLERQGRPITLSPEEICRLDPREIAYDHTLHLIEHYPIREIVDLINEHSPATKMTVPCFDGRLGRALARKSDETGHSIERILDDINNTRRSRSLEPLRIGQKEVDWTDEEDSLLRQLKETTTMSWRDIHDHFPHRTLLAIQGHYHTRLKDGKRRTGNPTSHADAAGSGANDHHQSTSGGYQKASGAPRPSQTPEPAPKEPKQRSAKGLTYTEFKDLTQTKIARLASYITTLRHKPNCLRRVGMNYIVDALSNAHKRTAQRIQTLDLPKSEEARRIISLIDKVLARFIAAASPEGSKDAKEAFTCMLFQKRMEQDEILFAPRKERK